MRKRMFTPEQLDEIERYLDAVIAKCERPRKKQPPIVRPAFLEVACVR